jgi:hypothetical protein
VHAVNLIAAGTREEDMVGRLAERVSRADVLGDGVRAVDLSAEAQTEGRRIRMARRLLERDADRHETRALLTRIRSRHRAGATRCYWLFRLLLAGADGRIVATAFLPLGATGPAWLPASTEWTRRLLDPSRPVVEDVRTTGCATLIDDATRATGCALRMHADRERALRDELLRHQARLSSGLLQADLFGHRRERAAAAQAAVLEEALASSALRLEQLSAAALLQLESCELVFAVAVD